MPSIAATSAVEASGGGLAVTAVFVAIAAMLLFEAPMRYSQALLGGYGMPCVRVKM
jgi:hypothetical protein